MPIGTKLGVEK